MASQQPKPAGNPKDDSASQEKQQQPSQQIIPVDPTKAHTPSLAGSVLETPDGITGNTLTIRIQNIASTANFGVRLDLKKIALKCRNAEFNPRRFAAGAWNTI